MNGANQTAASRCLALLPALLAAQLAFAAWVLAAGMPGMDGPAHEWPVLILVAVGNQLLVLLRALPVLALLSWPLLASRRPRILALAALWSLFLLLQVALEQYYLVARTPLGADLFGYSLAEIRVTVAGAARTDLLGLAGWLAPLLVLWALLAWCARRFAQPRPQPRVLPFATLVLAGIAAWWLPVAPATAGFADEAAGDLATGKLAYFVADLYGSWRVQGGNATAIHAEDRSTTASPVAPVDARYPFLRPDHTPDTLGEYLGPTRDGRPPNLVVIVVEGLGRSFSGPDAALGSFTPFLDELGARSLYFDNFLANQGRTFGVLPSLFGSLPVAEHGYAALGSRMPAHAGLFSVLQQQGYHGRFYNGTDTGFDDERGYLQQQGVQDIVDLRSFGPGYARNPFSSWGYPDRELVSRVLADNARLQPPFVLGIQTISMHTSYRFPGQERYEAMVADRLQALGVPADRWTAYHVHDDIYSAILYTDDQLRRYFATVANAPWYADTIFIITGDHRLAELPPGSYIERYHVPLIVFSPLLLKPARFRAVSSHLDVTPSLLALLAHRYGLRRPARATWTGSGLDTSPGFGNRHDIALKPSKTGAIDFASGRWFLHKGRLFELQDGIRALAIDDDAAQHEVQARMQRYLAANATFLQRMQLSPDGATPELVAYDAKASMANAPAPAAVPAPSGLGVEAVRVEADAGEARVVASFANGDAADSRDFVPLAALTRDDGSEVLERSGAALRLHGRERRDVQLALPLGGLAPGRYYVSVAPTDPDSGKPVGRGHYRIPFDVAPREPGT